MSTNLVGRILDGRYQVEAFLGAGGSAQVYRVRDLHDGYCLAMKVLQSELADHPALFKSFQRESEVLCRLDHPNIVPFYGLYQTDEFIYILEKYIHGDSLKSILVRAKGGYQGAFDALSYLKPVCRALGYAHSQQIIHCDIKPANILVDYKGHIYLTDFGISRRAYSATTTLAAAGTSGYMSPEQIRGEPVSPATDVYALGVVLYQMLTGRRPFLAEEIEQSQSNQLPGTGLRQATLFLAPPDPRQFNPAIPLELSRVILIALAKRPEDRFPGVQDFFNAACRAAGFSQTDIPDQVKKKNLEEKAANPGSNSSASERLQETSDATRKKRQILVLFLVITGLVISAALILAGSFSGGSKPDVPGIDTNISSRILTQTVHFNAPTIIVTQPQQETTATTRPIITPTAPGAGGQVFRICVRQVEFGDSLIEINPNYVPGGWVNYFAPGDCHPNDNGAFECINQMELDDPLVIQSGWWIKLEKISQTTCETAGGIWGLWVTP